MSDDLPMLIFDGDCGFCTSTAGWIERHLPDHVQVIAWQFVPDLDAYELTPAEANERVWWIAEDGTKRGGHLAVGDALIAAGGFLGLLGRLSLLPPFVWLGGPIYHLISRNRHRMPGGTPACRIDNRG